jgi:hypothetical protein
MKTARLVAAFLLAAIALAGCGATKSAPTAAPTTMASPIATSTPVAFYATQYDDIATPGLAAEAALEGLPASDTTAQRQVLATNMVTVEKTADAALLRDTWPPNVAPDVRALVAATAPLLVDLADLAAHKATLVNDLATAKAAANVVHADLGLPPLS